MDRLHHRRIAPGPAKKAPGFCPASSSAIWVRPRGTSSGSAVHRPCFVTLAAVFARRFLCRARWSP